MAHTNLVFFEEIAIELPYFAVKTERNWKKTVKN